MNKIRKHKCFNCEGYGHLSRECRKPKKVFNAEIKNKLIIKKEYNGFISKMTCNYCKKLGAYSKRLQEVKI